MANSYKYAFYAQAAFVLLFLLAGILPEIMDGLTQLNYLVIDCRSSLRWAWTNHSDKVITAALVVAVTISTIVLLRYYLARRAFKLRTKAIREQAVEVIDIDYEGTLEHDDHGYYLEVEIAGIIRHVRMDVSQATTLAMSAILPNLLNTTKTQPSELEMAVPTSYMTKTKPPRFQAILHSSPGNRVITSGYGVLGRLAFNGTTYGVTALHVLEQLRHQDVYLRTANGDMLFPKSAPIFFVSKQLDLVLLELPKEFWSAAQIKAMKIGRGRTKHSCQVLTPKKDGSWEVANGIQRGPDHQHPQPFRMAHSASTQPGASGGFVMNGKRAIGIHTRALRDQNLNLFTSFEALRFALPGHLKYRPETDDNETQPPENYWQEEEYDDRAAYGLGYGDMYLYGNDKKAWRNNRFQVHLRYNDNTFVVVDHGSDEDEDDAPREYHWEPGMAWGDQESIDGDDYYDDEIAHSDEESPESKHDPPADQPQHFQQLKSQKPSSPDKSSEASAGCRPKTTTSSKAKALSPLSDTPPAPSQAVARRRRNRRRKRNNGSSKDSRIGTNRTPPSKESAPPSSLKGRGASKALSRVRWSEKLCSFDA